MNSTLTNDTKAIILLCGVLGKGSSVSPLSQKEYNSLVRWLVSEDMRPQDMLQLSNITSASIATGIIEERLKNLIGRGVHLGFAVEEWERNGIWVVSRSDRDYPSRYRKHLKEQAPPLLFGVGNRNLLEGGGVAIIGSRNIDASGEAFTRETAELCAFNNLPVVSGGARGVDQIAMTASLDSGGTSIGVLAENLLKKSLDRTARNAISEDRLLLISPYHPKARFTVGTAMGRNKLIYALADYGLVVRADHNKGGTWAGAIEELKRENARTIFIQSGKDASLGNKKLLELGALEWPKKINSEPLDQQLAKVNSRLSKRKRERTVSLFDYQEENILHTKKEARKESSPIETVNIAVKPENQVYEAVLPVILNQLNSPIAVDDLSKRLNVSKMQLSSWLKKAVKENKVKKLSHPIRYQKLEGIDKTENNHIVTQYKS